MKKFKKPRQLIAMLLSICLSSPLFAGVIPAFAATIGDYEYSINADQQSCTITKYIGAGGEVFIPSTLNGYSVTAIGNRSFKDIITISKITIPNSIVTIGEYGFSGMTNLTSVTIPNSVTTLGNYAFMLDQNLLTLTIPNSVTSIGNQAFSNCYKLESLTLSNRLTTLGFAAFTNCRKIKTIEFPSSLTYIPNSSFIDCSALENVFIPESVTSIQDWAFHRAHALKTLTIPKSVQTIGSAAFYHCQSLTKLYLDGTPIFHAFAFGSTPLYPIPTIYSPTLTSVSGFTCTPVPIYNILANSGSHGAIVPSAATAMAGEVINIALNPNQGYSKDLTSLKYNDGSVDVVINGTSFIMPSKDITVSGDFIEIPIPIVTTPHATTTDLTPTWYWNDPTGENYFRYKLNDGTWQYTVKTQFTPTSELLSGTYTLSVQAMNPKGDWSNSGAATLTVLSTVTSVVTTPLAISVQKGNTQPFSATVLGTGGPVQTVTWQVIGGASGTQITSGGTLTVVSNETANTLTVTATSTQDVSKVGTASITVLDIPTLPPVVESVLISPVTINVQKGTVQSFTALVNGSNSPLQTVGWTVSGAAIGTQITSGGALTVASDETASTLTVTATSMQDSSKFGTATVTLTDSPPLTYSLVVSAGTGGSITTGTTGNYQAGTLIPIVATASQNYNFSGWTSAGGGSFENASSPNTTFTTSKGSSTVTANFTYVGGRSGGTGGVADNSEKISNVSSTSTSVTTPTYSATVTMDSLVGNLTVEVDQKTGVASLNLSNQQGEQIAKGKNIFISMPPISGVTAYTVGTPYAYLNIPGGLGTLTIESNTGSITLPADMLTGILGAEGKKAELTIRQGDKSTLTNTLKLAIGERPMIQLTVKIDGQQIEWHHPKAFVKISLPYKPTDSELKTPESLMVWYIDKNGNNFAVSNGHYNSATGSVTFISNHLSDFGVGYKPVSFTDMPQNQELQKAINFIAARGISSGKGNGRYCPEAKMTSAEFLVMLMKAFEIRPIRTTTANFVDAGKTYYTDYLGVAKELGITQGVGNNRFAPDREITKKEMCAMLYNTMKVTGKLPEGTKDSIIKLYAIESTTRAKTASLLYNLLSN